jgi:hypothetical protein
MAMLNQLLARTSAHKSPSSPMGLITALALCAGMGVSVSNAQEINEEGWTVLEPSADTRFVFVSSSTGNDSNSGYSPSKAVESFSRAKELIRDNSADWMLLKRGDVWDEGIGGWTKSGRSAQERIVVASYGQSDERPRIEISSGSVIAGNMNTEVGNVAIMGLHMKGVRPEETTPTGIRWLATGENLLVEDCFIEGFKDNITCQAVGGEFKNFALRRSVVVDAWSTSSHSQGLFVKDSNGVVIEENFFDHNGWNEGISDANATMFNHNLYLQKGVMGIEFHGNITARSSGAGIQMRSGGNASENVIYANPLGIRFGYRTIDWPSESASGSLIDNVVLGGPLAVTDGAGIGIWVERADDTLVKGNVVAQYHEGSLARAYTLGGHAGDIDYIGNVAYEWVSSSGLGMGIKSSVSGEGTIRFLGNHWYMPGTDRVFSIADTNGMEFGDNGVYGFDSDDDVFHIEGSVINHDEWVELDNVEGDDLEDMQFPDAGRNLEGYARHLGYDDTEAFFSAARDQSRTNWDARLTGRAASEWIRAGYIVQD